MFGGIKVKLANSSGINLEKEDESDADRRADTERLEPGHDDGVDDDDDGDDDDFKEDRVYFTLFDPSELFDSSSEPSSGLFGSPLSTSFTFRLFRGRPFSFGAARNCAFFEYIL